MREGRPVNSHSHEEPSPRSRAERRARRRAIASEERLRSVSTHESSVSSPADSSVETAVADWSDLLDNLAIAGPDAPELDAPDQKREIEQAAEHAAEVEAQNATLQAELVEKERLITALTDRLELAAEQLDRLRRSGADRGWRGGGGVPADVIQDQRAAVEELKQIAARFDEMQAATTLGRLEMQVSELRDLVVSIGQGAATASPGRRGDAPQAATPPAHKARPGGSWWDRQKAALLEDDPANTADAPDHVPTEQPAPTDLADDHAADSSSETSSEATANWQPLPFAELELPDLPAEPDWDELTLESACALLRERDALILELREPLAAAQMAGLLAQGLGRIEALPEPQQARLRHLEETWEARFRKHETELSIERARLAREQMTAKQLQEQLRKQLAETGGAPRAGEGESRQERRWFRFMHQQDRNGTAE
jgi:hypothetical protein